MIALPASIAFLLFALLFTAVGQLLFRMYYVCKSRAYLTAALGTFLAVPIFSYFALLNLTLAFVYMSTALTHVLVLILSQKFLKERLVREQYLSMFLIVIGIVVFNL